MDHVVAMYMASFPEPKEDAKRWPGTWVAVPAPDPVADEIRRLREDILRLGVRQERMEKLIRALRRSSKRK